MVDFSLYNDTELWQTRLAHLLYRRQRNQMAMYIKFTRLFRHYEIKRRRLCATEATGT